MKRKIPIFYSALLLTGVNLLLRLVSTSFQVYLSGRIGAAGIGLMQLVLSVGALSVTAGMAGIRTATMYLTAEELGRKRPQNVRRVLSGCLLYSIFCSGAVTLALYCFAPFLAEHWIGDHRTVGAIRLYAGFLPVICLCGVLTGYFTAANRIGTLAAIEVAEQLFCMVATVLILTLWAGSDPVKACKSVILGSGKDFFIDKKVDLLGMDEEVLIINTCAVKYEREGVGSLLVGYVLKKHAKDYEKIYVPAWKHAGITNAGKLLEKFEFKPVFEIEKYWYEDSLNIKNFCPICDNPCLCSLVIYLRKKV